jgi:hypothetical protein
MFSIDYLNELGEKHWELLHVNKLQNDFTHDTATGAPSLVANESSYGSSAPNPSGKTPYESLPPSPSPYAYPQRHERSSGGRTAPSSRYTRPRSPTRVTPPRTHRTMATQPAPISRASSLRPLRGRSTRLGLLLWYSHYGRPRRSRVADGGRPRGPEIPHRRPASYLTLEPLQTALVVAVEN